MKLRITEKSLKYLQDEKDISQFISLSESKIKVSTYKDYNDLEFEKDARTVELLIFYIAKGLFEKLPDENNNWVVGVNEYKLNDVEAIRKLLNKQTVQWQYTLGLVGLYDFWNPEKKPKKIPYAQLDAILRTLGQTQFTGYEEWSACVAINKFFEPLHTNYVDATESTYDIASKHDIVIRKIEELSKPTDVKEDK